MAKKFSKPELSRKINGDLGFDANTQNAPENPKIRLDLALANQYPIYSRSTIQKFIKNGQASVDGTTQTTPKLLIDPDAKLDLKTEELANRQRPPVIFENENVIVFNKPIGMLSVNKGAFNAEQSIEDYGEIVHRLDRDTSGVIIVAKNADTKAYLQKQFQQRKTHKTYYAITSGVPTPAHAMIDIPLTRNLKRPTTFMVSPTGREAQTEYFVEKSNEKYALVRLQPRTGRTHQLRIHLAHLKTPILGDPVYNPKGPQAPRMFLHAASLEITVPHNGKNERITFTAPLPADFEKAFS